MFDIDFEAGVIGLLTALVFSQFAMYSLLLNKLELMNEKLSDIRTNTNTDIQY